MISIILVLILFLYLGILTNSLNILAVSGIIVILGYKYRIIFKKAYILYIIALILSAVSLYFYDQSYFDYINNGIIGYGFLFVVMITGVLPNKFALTKKLKASRGVFSILAFILITPHAMGHIFGLLDSVNLFGIAAYVLMLPLTIISFKVVRKQISNKDWVEIQRVAYIIYIILAVHLIYVASWENKIIYAVIFTLYLNNKIIKEFRK